MHWTELYPPPTLDNAFLFRQLEPVQFPIESDVSQRTRFDLGHQTGGIGSL